MTSESTSSMRLSQLFILALACALAVANIYYNQPLLVTIGASFHRSAEDAAHIATLTQMGYATGLLLFVPLGDRFSPRRLIVVLLLLNILSLLCFAWAPQFSLLLVASFAIGMTAVSAQLIIPATAAAVAPEKRGHALGILLSGLSAGLLFARILSGWIGGLYGWSTLFELAALLNGLLLVVIYRQLPRLQPRGAEQERYWQLLWSLGTLLKREASLRMACATGFCFFAAFCALWGSLSDLLARPPYGFSTPTIGMFGIIGIAGLIASPFLGRWVDRRGYARVLLARALMVLTTFGLLFGLSHQLVALVLAMVLLDIGNRAAMVANQQRIYRFASEARSRLNTVYMVCYFAGGATGTALGSQWAAAHGWLGLSLSGTMFIATAICLHLTHISRSKRRLMPQ